MQPLYQPDRTLVDVCYRKNLREYNEWEAAECKRQEEAVQALIRAERRPLRLPKWAVVIAGSLIGSALLFLASLLRAL